MRYLSAATKKIPILKKCFALSFVCFVTTQCLGQIATVTCKGSTATLSGPGTASYFWFTDAHTGSAIATGHSFTTPVLTSGATYYYSTVADNPNDYTRYRADVYISVPDATFTATSPGCINTSITFDDENTYSGRAFTGNGSYGASLAGAYPMTVTDNLTIEAWVKWNGGSGNQFIVVNGSTGANGYAIYVDGSTKKLGILLGGVSFLASTATLNIASWQHVAAVRNAGVWALYINGQSTGLSSTLSPNAVSGGFYIGTSGSGEYFNGNIDEVLTYNTALDVYGITRDRAISYYSTNSGLTGHWKFDELSGTTVADASGGNHNLTLNNAAARTSSANYAWSFTGGGTATGMLTGFAFSTSGAKTATLVVTDAFGCTATSSQQIAVSSSAPAGVTATISQSTICQGTAVAIKATGGGIAIDENFNNGLAAGWQIGANWQLGEYYSGSVTPDIQMYGQQGQPVKPLQRW